MVVTACPDGVARVRDASNGQLVGELQGHAARLGTVMFSPDGRRILTSSEDRTARIWPLDPMPGDPEAIGLWAEVATGTSLYGERGLTASEWKDRRRLVALRDKAPPTP